MSIAKTIGEVMPCDVYTISTLRLYAANRPYCMVIMDARANRVYCGIYNEQEIIFNDKAVPIDQIDVNGYELIGDGYLFGKEDNYGDTVADHIAGIAQFVFHGSHDKTGFHVPYGSGNQDWQRYRNRK